MSTMQNNATFGSVVRFYQNTLGLTACTTQLFEHFKSAIILYHIPYSVFILLYYVVWIFISFFSSPFSFILVFCFRSFFTPSFFKTFQVSLISIDSNCSRFLYYFFFKKCSKSLALKKSTFYKIMHTER